MLPLVLFVCFLATLNAEVMNEPQGPPHHLPFRRMFLIRKSEINQTKELNADLRSMRRKRLGFAPPPVPPPVPVASPAYSYSYAQAPSQNYYPAPSYSIPSAPAPPPALPPPPPAPPVLIAPLPPQAPQPLPSIGPTPMSATCAPAEAAKPNYPLPSCYTNNYGFMCCNQELEDSVVRSFNELRDSRPDWSSCNLQQITNKVQQNAEREYNTTFEVIAGVGDYASRSHFWSNLICKLELDGRFILVYATAHLDAEDYPDNGSEGYAEGNTVGDHGTGTETNVQPPSPPEESAYGNEGEATPPKEGSYKKFNFSSRV
ncbi:Ground-like domain-containing protein [Aphelenchoides besseyi]|nr:Ground-like domain-containing protein [Aphelenchoides besseyi]